MNEEIKVTINSYLTFMLGEELFASNVNKILNILEMVKITKVPRAPEYMKGVINLRGTVLPVIDTRIKFNLPPIEYTKNTCILVLTVDIDGELINVGALVDSVQEVVEVDDNNILPPPSIGAKYKSKFIEGMIKRDDQFIMLLNLDKVFSSEEVIAMQDSTNTAGSEEISII
jgi:purine-binding chemotaxis protein CheW